MPFMITILIRIILVDESVHWAAYGQTSKSLANPNPDSQAESISHFNSSDEK